nr:putative reverse transcriptase domain-containing protein [Tanacetum cinerariifolium]
EPDLISWIKEAQKEDSEIWTIVENLDKQVVFRLDDDNVLWITLLVGWQRFFSKKLYDYTVLRQRLYQTETYVSRLVFGKVGERVIEGPEMIEVTNAKFVVAKEKLKEARTRQKSYADKHRRSLEFQLGDHVFLKVSLARGFRRFGIKGKLSPRFIGSFEILDRVGE